MGAFLEKLYPLIIGVCFALAAYFLQIDHTIKNFDDLLVSVITFGSIVTGFLGALLGILMSIRNSDIVKEIFNSHEKSTLKFYFYETFTLGFMLIILTSSMQILIGYEFAFTYYIYYLWIVISFAFIPSTYRIVNILLEIFFKSNNSKNRPSSNVIDDRQEREELKKRLSNKPNG